MNIEKIFKALHFCTKFHDGQYRKGNNEPYATHPIRVFLFLRELGCNSTDVLCASLLHDIIEDTKCTIEEITLEFGPIVSSIVMELTNNEDLPTPEKKAKMIEKVKTISLESKLIKCADRIDNLRDVKNSFSEKSAKFYLDESVKLFDSITYGLNNSSNHPCSDMLARSLSVLSASIQKLH